MEIQQACRYTQLTAGVPQGTKRPIGFQVLINDAANAQSEYWKYVDDLTFAENTGGDDQGNLQDDLQHFGHQIMGSISMPRNTKLLRSNLATLLHIEQT